MQFKQLGDFKLGLLEDLDLHDGDILQGEDGITGLLAFLTNGIGNQLANQVLDFTGTDFAFNDLEHALANLTDLGTLSVASLLDLLLLALSESNHKDTQQVAIGGLDIDVGFNQALPLLNHRAELVLSNGHAVEVGQAGLTLDFINAHAELAESLIFAFGVQVTQAEFKDTSLQAVFGRAQTSSAVDESLTGVAVGEIGGGAEIVPFLAGEGIDDLLLALTLLTL